MKWKYATRYRYDIDICNPQISVISTFRRYPLLQGSTHKYPGISFVPIYIYHYRPQSGDVKDELENGVR